MKNYIQDIERTLYDVRGNVTLHPEDALQRCDALKVVAATKRNAAHC